MNGVQKKCYPGIRASIGNKIDNLIRIEQFLRELLLQKTARE